jgi:hypothetical protein
MTVLQFSSGIAAATCAVLLFMTGWRSKDNITRFAHFVYAAVMTVAAASYFLIAHAIDVPIRAIAQAITPIGWGALAILLARMLQRGR